MGELLTIKCLFPKKNYLLRKVSIKTGNGETYRIGHGETIQVNDAGDYLLFKLDYHRFKLELNNLAEKSYILVYLKYRDTFPYYFTDLMFKNAMYAEVIDESSFNSFEKDYLGNISIIPAPFSISKKAIIGFAMLLFVGMIVYSVGWIPKGSSDKNFLFFIGLIELLIVIRLFQKRNAITQYFFFYSSLAIYIPPITIAIFSDLCLVIKIILTSVSLLIIILAAVDNSMSVKNEIE